MKKILLSAIVIMASALNINAQTSSDKDLKPREYVKRGTDLHFGVAAGLATTTPNLGGFVYLDGGGVNYGMFQFTLLKFSGSVFSTNFLEDPESDFDDVTITNLDVSSVLYLRSPIVRPYVGIGIGYESIEYTESAGGESGSQSHIPVYFSLGARATIVPFIKPFAEIRVRTASVYDSVEDSGYDIAGRAMAVVGLSFKF